MELDLQEVQVCINNNEWAEAKKLLSMYKDSIADENLNDIFYILEASLYMNDQNYNEALASITQGLYLNYANYELYFMLGNLKEIEGNYAQALFAYENAVFYCHTVDQSFLIEHLQNFKDSHTELPGKVAIIIVTYKNLDFTRVCVDSIMAYNLQDTYEIIIIDNASNDGTKEWLSEQKNLKYIVNEDNLGFPAACNQGIMIADKDSDIFLLNNDTIVMPNSIFCLRMGLYEDNHIGISGSVSNRVSNNQKIKEEFPSVDQYITYCEHNNIYDITKHEYRIKLVGFAMLIKRKLLDSIGYLDEAYGLGHFEDDDICIRTVLEGYNIILCKDSFIYHFGNQSFVKNKKENFQKHQDGILRNLKYFINKWGLDLEDYSDIRDDIIALIDQNKADKLSILEVGCGYGSNLLKLKSIYQNADVYGIEIMERVAEIGGSILNIIHGNIEDKNLPYQENNFDYIIVGDVLEHLHNPEDILLYLKNYLKKDGYIIASIPNILHFSVMLPLLQGNFTYKDSGLLNKTHLRFFTRNEIIRLFINAGYTIESIYCKYSQTNNDIDIFIHNLASLDSNIEEDNFKVNQYLIRANK